MREIAQWVFEVDPGETVSIRVVPRQSEARFVGVWRDDRPFAAEPNPYSYPYLIYSFTVSRPAGQSHTVKLECNFTPDASAQTRYDLWLSGSLRAGEFLRTVNKDDNHDVDIVFAIAQPKRAEPDEPSPPPDGWSETRGGGKGKGEPKGWTRAKPPLRGGVPDDKSRSAGSKGGGKRKPMLKRPMHKRPPREALHIGREDLAARGRKEKRGRPKAGRAARQGRQKRRVVNVGFASEADAATLIGRDRPLACGRSYYFWLEVGRPMAQSLEADKPTALPSEQLPPQARLKVVLFGFKDGIEIKKGADIGELELGPGGSASVSRAPARPASVEKGSAILGRRLFFPVRTPSRSGTYRLRCSIYYEQLLIQSRLITARVMVRPRQFKNALRSAVDYTLSRTMQPSHLAGMAPHRLSLMVNSNGNGTFGLRVFGETIKDDASFDGQELQDLIDQARGGLRTAAWGDAQPWQPDKQYRYDRGGNFNQLKGDLIRLAKRGYSFYDHIIDRFSGGAKKSKALAALMLKPGHVQIALKESARHILPAAMIYDYPLDGGLKDANFKICESFSKAFNGGASLENSDCFKGACPTRADSKTVCPSGFWGYRHYLGMPLSDTEDIPTEIAWQGSPHLTIGVSTNLQLRADHQKALNALKPGLAWDYADTRDAVFTSLKESHPHLVYFYCHGGLDHNEAYIKVGPADGPVIVRANLREQDIEWQDPRPLIFINGCHTTALEPEQALEFVTSFVEVANAAGVIGTEITIFESLARSFAEDCLRRFIVDGKSIGEAIREARLALLKAGNPLGLVYIPFVITNLRMVGQ
jgi:hypothetical protein